MKIYISGPMSGIVEHNFPAFHAAEERLFRVFGEAIEIVNPAKLNLHLGMEAEWHQYLRNDIKALCDCDTIYMLPGWEKSRGALLELHIAERLAMKVIYES